MVPVYVGLGSNLADPLAQLDYAVKALKGLPHCRFVACSRYFSSKPMGPQDQPDYINAAVCIETDLKPLDLLTNLQAIEQQQGRERIRHWGPRTLDLDLLLYGSETLQTETLTVPHPGIFERSFVLLPLFDLNPELLIPGQGLLANLITQISTDDLIPLE